MSFIEKDGKIFSSTKNLEIYIPQFYFDNDLARYLGREIETYGIFNFRAWDTGDRKSAKLQMMAFPLDVILIPEEIIQEEIKEIVDGEKVHTLKFNKSKHISETTNIIINQSASFSKFLNLLSSGRIPKTAPYDKILSMCIDLQEFNNKDLGIPSLGYEILISEVYRNKSNIDEPFRFKAGSKANVDMLAYKAINTRTLSNTNVFTGIIFEDFDASVQSGVVRTVKGLKDSESPVEKTIKY